MSIASGVTLMGRRQAEALMDSECTITSVATAGVDPATGEYTTTTTTVYSGKCRLRWPTALANEVDGAGQIIAKQSPTLSIPIEGTGDVLPDMIATITASPLDESTVGLKLRVKGVQFQTHATARRLQVEVES